MTRVGGQQAVAPPACGAVSRQLNRPLDLSPQLHRPPNLGFDERPGVAPMGAEHGAEQDGEPEPGVLPHGGRVGQRGEGGQ